MRSEFDALGGGMQEGAIQASVELNDDLTRLRLTLLSMRSAIAVRILPAVDWMVQKLTSAAHWISEVTRESNILESAAYVLGGVLVAAGILTAAAWGPTVLTVLGLAVAIGALILVVDDLITTVRGGESVTRDLIDAIAGVGATEHYLQTIRTAYADLAAYARIMKQEAANAWATIVETAQPVIAVINTIIAAVDSLIARLGIASSLGEAVSGAASRVGNALFGGFGEALGRMGQLGQERRSQEARNRQATRFAQEGIPLIGGRGVLAREALLPSTPEGTGTVLADIPSRPGTRVQNTIDARQDVNVRISEATDAAEVDRRVRAAIQESQDRQSRQIEAALVRGGAS
jgi:hypothetical protein